MGTIFRGSFTMISTTSVKHFVQLMTSFNVNCKVIPSSVRYDEDTNLTQELYNNYPVVSSQPMASIPPSSLGDLPPVSHMTIPPLEVVPDSFSFGSQQVMNSASNLMTSFNTPPFPESTSHVVRSVSPVINIVGVDEDMDDAERDTQEEYTNFLLDKSHRQDELEQQVTQSHSMETDPLIFSQPLSLGTLENIISVFDETPPPEAPLPVLQLHNIVSADQVFTGNSAVRQSVGGRGGKQLSIMNRLPSGTVMPTSSGFHSTNTPSQVHLCSSDGGVILPTPNVTASNAIAASSSNETFINTTTTIPVTSASSSVPSVAPHASSSLESTASLLSNLEVKEYIKELLFDPTFKDFVASVGVMLNEVQQQLLH
jgi:hypothetical protein